MTHTPSRWKHDGKQFVGTDEDDTQTICYLSDHRNRRPRSKAESKANLDLITEAPELLGALQDIVYVLTEPVYDVDMIKMPGEDAAVKRAQRVIKKVTGQK